MTPDQTRLAEDRATPRIVALWRALTALRFLQSGAHPDDETSAMLAALRFRDGIGVSYVCSSRGEGGQNDIGQQTGVALGVLRTAEMEAAAARLDILCPTFLDVPEQHGHHRAMTELAHDVIALAPDRTFETPV